MIGESATPLRVGLVGFGKMGLLHGAIVNGLSGSRLAAVADNTPGLVDVLGRVLPGVVRYDDFDSMLAREPLDAVFITSPTHFHARMALACAEAGVPFLVEKPLAVRSDECGALLGVLERAHLTNAVGYMARHLDTMRAAKRIIAAGALGRLIHLESSMYVAQLFGPGRGWRYDPALSGGGVLLTQNSHLIDLLLWLFGPIARVSGHVKSGYENRRRFRTRLPGVCRRPDGVHGLFLERASSPHCRLDDSCPRRERHAQHHGRPGGALSRGAGRIVRQRMDGAEKAGPVPGRHARCRRSRGTRDRTKSF